MKKLMIALTAMAATALVAKADPWVGVTFDEIVTGGGYITGNPLNVQLDDSQLPGGSGPHLWYSEAASTEVGHAGEVESTIAEENGNKFLAVEETVVLERKIAEEPQNIGDGIAINTKVQFTAADEAPEAVDGDKLIVWMRAASEAEGTEGEEGYKPALCAAVMVTDKNGATAIKELADDEVETYTAAWHTLKVMAVTAGTEAQPTASFTVELDGVVFDGTFDSMVKGGDAAQTIASVGFKGTGKVDDISFEPMEPVEDVVVTVNAEGLELYIGEDADDYDGEPIEVKPGSELIFWLDADADAVTCPQAQSITFDEDQGLTKIVVKVADADMTVVITVGEQPGPGPDPTPIEPTVTNTKGLAVTGIAESYLPGATIDPADIVATPSKEGYAATVTVKVNGETIEEAYVLVEGDEITIEIDEAAIEYTITYSYAGLAEGDAEKVVNENVTTYTVDSTEITIADITCEGYTTASIEPAQIAAGSTGDKTVTVTFEAVVPTYALTLPDVENATAAVTDADGETITDLTAIAKDTVVTVTWTAEEGFKITEGATQEITMTEDKAAAAPTVVADTPTSDWPEKWNGGSAATPEQAAAFTEWAKTNDATDENAMAAFLLGQDVTAYAPLAVKSIAIVDGKAVIESNLTTTPNGVIKIVYGETLTAMTNTAAADAELPATAASQFYKFVVDFQ